jgi:hypothetical protein
MPTREELDELFTPKEVPSQGGFRGKEQIVTDPNSGGKKGTKPERYDLLPWDVLDEVARLYEFGTHKYDDHNWRKGFKWSLSFAALMRHARAFWEGEDTDPETQCHHLASVVFHALALMWFQAHEKGTDDRYVERSDGS